MRASLNTKRNRFDSVMANRKGEYFKIPKFKWLASGKDFTGRALLKCFYYSFSCQGIGNKRNTHFAGKGFKSCNVVRMFVRDDNALNLFKTHTNLFKPLSN